MHVIIYFVLKFFHYRGIKLPSVQRAVNKHGGKGKAVGSTGIRGKNRVTQSTGGNTQPSGSKPDILDDVEETEDNKTEKVEEEKKNDKGRKQTAQWGKPFSTGLGAGQICKMMP